MSINFKYIIIVFFSLILTSCVRSKRFTQKPEQYKSDLQINSKYDEIETFINGDETYVLAKYNINGRIHFEVLKTIIKDDCTCDITPVNDLFDGMIPTAAPCVRKNKSNGLTEYYFSAKKCKDCDSDLYYSYKIDSTYSKPVPIDIDLNSKNDEIQPRISEDGEKLLFVSNNNSIGGKDIFISKKDKKGVWTKAENLGEEVNTEFDEETPNFGKNDEIYFSTNGKNDDRNFDIHKINYDFRKNKVVEVTRLPDIINTPYNEKSYSVYNDEVFYSSDRFGNYDIVREKRCMGAMLSLELFSNQSIIENTQVIIRNADGEEIINEFASSGYLEYDLLQNESYELEILNECLDSFDIVKEINIPCNDAKNLVYNYKINYPNQVYSYEFEETNIPFFVTGYYHPNTTRNLNDLKLLFKQNRFISDSTNFVEEPVAKYEKYALEIDKAFQDIKEHLSKKVKEYNSNCFDNSQYLRITVTGFADPRAIADGMKYFGASIKDKSVDLEINNGDLFDNMQLSKLRAYHTANEVKSMLLTIPNYENIKDRIIWVVKGKGEAINKNQNLDLSRRVLIKIESIPYESN
mgnify:CR=1 FL=1